jgi:hypothetical protein
MGFIEHAGIEARLPQVSRKAILLIEPVAILRMSVAKSFRESTVRSGYDDGMDV